MQIRRNTKAFKTILEIVSACQDRPDREKLIRLYITKAGHSIQERISVEGIQGGADLFYDMGYQAVLNNLKSPNHQLVQSDEAPGIYYFHSTSNKTWDETPFEFDEAIRKAFGSLPELPVTRKREKPEKVVLPTASVNAGSKPRTQEKAPPKKAPKIIDKGPKQPGYKLKRKVYFTALEKVIFRQPQVTRKDVLDYYDKIATYLLPHLKDRPVVIRPHSDNSRNTGYGNLAALAENRGEPMPDWIRTARIGKNKEELLLCGDREHLLFYVEGGCIAFASAHSRFRSYDSPDYIVIGLDSDSDFAKIIDVALAAREILNGLQLPSFVKTNGSSGLHVYIPLDTKSDFDAAQKAAEYICKLVRIKVPDLVSLEGTEDNNYRKVSLDFRLNGKGKSVIVPYSIAPDQPNVAAPLLWEDVSKGLKLEDYNYATIFKKLSDAGDPFRSFFRRKVNADALLEKFEESYSFLF